MRLKISMLFGVAGLAFPLAAASAQDGAAGDAADRGTSEQSAAEAGDAIVVTGSRLQRETGYDQPSPVTVVGGDMLQKMAPSTIPDALNQLPQFIGSQSRATCCGPSTSGNFLNLRGLGSQRVLILLDGDRVSATRETGDVDVNVLPELLVERVDIVTAGASAAYGSDAVTGVVNYVIDQDFEGIRFLAQSGLSSYGDNEEYRLGVAVGTSFADSRGSVIASVEHYNNNGLLVDARPEARDGHFLGGVGSPDLPFVNLTGIRNLAATDGGLIINSTGLPFADAGSPLAGNLFLPGGAGTRPFDPGTRIVGFLPTAVGGDGSIYGAVSALAALENSKFYGRMNYEFFDNLAGHIRVVVSESKTRQFPLESQQTGGTAFTIFRENAFLPASVGAQMDQLGVSSFRLARSSKDWGLMVNDYTNRFLEINFGLDGTLIGWDWQARYSHGRVTLNGGIGNNVILDRLYAAADAVSDPSTGQPTCNVSLTNPGAFPGCVPINLFGQNSASPEALDYILGFSDQRIRNTQDYFGLTAQRSLFSLPGGDVILGIGYEHIARSLLQETNALAVSQINPTGVRGLPTSFCPSVNTCRFGRFNQGNFGAADASDTRNEVFAEISVPLLEGVTLAETLAIDAAFRHTNYENSGGVNTWKVGVNYAPISGLRFRGTASRDIRAPNLFELFAGPTRSFGNTVLIRDPENPNPVPGSYVNLSQGNPALNPEIADTFTVGVVIEPPFLPGFSGSIDYWDVAISDEIINTSPQLVLDRCAQGVQSACEAISRDPGTGTITQIVLQRINQTQSAARGMDFDFSYVSELGGGDLRLRLLASRLFERSNTNEDVQIEFAGFAGTPEWSGNFSLNYDVGRFGFFWQQRLVGPVDRWLFEPPGSQVFEDPRFPAVTYTDISATWRIGEDERFEVFGIVNNLFNRRPPIQPTPFVAGLAFPTFPTGNINYDIVGTQFTFGVRGTF